MKKFWIFSIVALVIFGCNGSEQEATSILSEVGSEGTSQADQEESMEVGDQSGERAGAGDIDPAFEGYVYPAAVFDGKFSSGNMMSVSYFSQDDYSKVVEFYEQKFPGTAIQSGTITNFSKENEDGSSLAATVSSVNDRTQIILRLTGKS